MNRTDDKGITAVCAHPCCRWHVGGPNRDAIRGLAQTHANESGRGDHAVQMFGSEMDARNDVHRQSGQARDFHSRSGRIVLEVIRSARPQRKDGGRE